MNVLILNCGSSSQAFRVYAAPGAAARAAGEQTRALVSGKARHVATASDERPWLEARWGETTVQRRPDLSTHARAAEAILDLLDELGVGVDAIGHRFVDGGERFVGTTEIDDETLPGLRATAHLAPLHNPSALAVIDVCRARHPGVAEFAVFDTAFFADLPEAAATYALPPDLARRYGFRKRGFHGLSYQHATRRAAALLGRPVEELRLVVAHLGTGGSSVAAIEGGRPVDTSIGTTMSGLVMSTRCGDLPPEVQLALIRDGFSADEIEDLLARRSGLLGLAGSTSDLLEVIARAEAGDPACRLAFEVYVRRLGTYLGAYAWLLGGVDAIVFTDDVGTRAWQVREAACRGAGAIGALLDPAANRAAVAGEAAIHAPGSPTAILVVPADEEGVILEEVLARLGEGYCSRGSGTMTVGSVAGSV